MEWVLAVNIVEAMLLSWFVSSLLDIKDHKWLYRILLFISTLSVVSISNYVNMYDMFLTTLIILTSIFISLFFVTNTFGEILFVCCLEALLVCCSITMSILVCFSMDNNVIDIVGKCLYFVLGMNIIRLIKREHLTFHSNLYYGLSVIIYILHLLIQHLLQLYLIIDVKNIDFLISFGLLIICILALLFSLAYISKLYKDRESYQELLKEKRNEEVLTYLYNEVKITKHDLKHDYILLQHYLDNNDINQIQDIIKQKHKKIQDIPSLINSKNTLLNTLINNKIIEAYSKNIKVQYKILVKETIPIVDYDFSQLLSNVLDNAVENCKVNGKIDIHIIQEEDFLHMQVSNSIEQSAIKNNLKTIKDQRYHGFGLKSIRKICQKYQGDINIREEDNVFFIELTLYLNNKMSK